MNERDDQALHELLEVWEESPPGETATQQLINQLRGQMEPALEKAAARRTCRPWLRKRWVWGTVGLILALEGVFAWNRLPPKYQLPRHVLPADNGYLDFIAAGDQIKAIDEKLRQRSPYDRGEAPPLTWDEAQALARQVQPALERARQGLGHSHIVPPHETYTAATVFPHLPPLRELARQGMLFADVQLVQGDRAGALDTYLLLLELGEQIKHGSLIDHLVGIAIQSIALSGWVNSPLAADLGLPKSVPSAYDAPRQAWQAEAGPPGQVTEPDWSGAVRRLQRMRTHLVPIREAMETEREIGLNTVYQTLTHPNPGRSFSMLVGGDSPERWFYGWLLQAGLVNRRKMFQEVEKAYGQIIAAADQGHRDDRDPEFMRHGNPFTRTLLPVTGSAWSKAALAHTALALLEMHCQAAAGKKGLPLPDPLAPGRSLRRHQEVFYSVGPDGQDDGGHPLPSRDFSDRDKRGDVSLLSWFKPAIAMQMTPATGGMGGGG